MRTTATRFLVLSAIFFLAAGCHCCIYISPKVWTETSAELSLPAASIDSLQVESHNGAVTVIAEDGVDTITADIKIKAGGSDEADAAQCLAAIELHTPIEGTTQVLTWRWKEDRKSTWAAAVSFDVKIPPALAVDVETHNGAVRLEGAVSNARLITHNGSVTVREHKGDLSIVTHNGEINSQSTSAEVMMVTHNGAIMARLAGSGALTGNLTTHNGAITVFFDGDVSAEIVGSTDNGRVSVNCDMEISVKKKNVVVGRIGSGEGKLELETHNGAITLN